MLKFDKDLMKVNIEMMVDTAVWKSKSKLDFDLRDDIKRCYFEFEQQAKKLCSTKKNQYLHKLYAVYPVTSVSKSVRMTRVLDWLSWTVVTIIES